jgi:3-keto-5-aminohexanoate cleavage enzyme
MTRLSPLPRIMVAPNGARRGKADHPALPVTIPEIVATAAACHDAGAGAMHAHVRDAKGRHLLDAGVYRELIAEMARKVPAMPVQITSEAAGRYSPAEQRALLREIADDAEGVSIALSEMLADNDTAAARASYHALAEAGVAVQHILYDAADVHRLAREIARGTVPGDGLTTLYVLGRYTTGQQSTPAMLTPFLDAAYETGLDADWATCAFGQGETACLRAALERGGKARVGFENNLFMADGTLAPDNAARVREIAGL